MDVRRVPRAALYGFTLSIALTACTASVDYAPKPVPVPNFSTMPERVTERGVTVGADPYVQPERQEAYFGLSLGRMDVLPVHLLIHNNSARAILVRPYEIALLLPDGRAVAPVGAAKAVERGLGAPVQFSSVGRSAASLAPLAGAYFGPRGYGAVNTVVAVEGIRLIGKLSAERELHRQLYADYRAKELDEITLNGKESRHGFVYFILPPDALLPADAKLLVRLIDTGDATSSVVELTLPRLDLRRPTMLRNNGDKPQKAPQN